MIHWDAHNEAKTFTAAERGLIIPVLIGPEHKILTVAAAANINLEPYELIHTEHSHAAAAKAVAMARAGEVQALMKGNLHTDELMHAVVDKAEGLLTARRISHVFAFDVPSYAKPLLITDAAINTYPTLMHKRDIIQNAIVDGPLAFDNAISPEAADIKGIISPVAGQADILLVPDLESGNMLAKQLKYFGNAAGAGITLGGRVPIILTSRADDTLSRLASCALAVLVVDYQEKNSYER